MGQGIQAPPLIYAPPINAPEAQWYPIYSGGTVWACPYPNNAGNTKAVEVSELIARDGLERKARKPVG